MFKRFICCSKPNTIITPVPVKETHDIIVNKNANLNSPIDLTLITLLDTRSIYDSTEWLSKLEKPIDWKDTIQFVPPVEKGIVIKVYDGDTITIASKLPYPDSPLYRFSVRLNGIDCPEIKGKDENEKECAQIAKNEVSKLIMNKIVTLKNIQTEKYGRILADVYIENLHVNQHLIEKRLAVKYDGGTKICPKNWLNYYNYGEI